MIPLIPPHRRFYQALLALLLIVVVASCAPATPAAPSIETIIRVETVEATQVVTSIQTVEVTRLVDVPVTNTPTVTPDWTPTPAFTSTVTKKPTATNPWVPPRVEVVGVPGTTGTICYYGPDEDYLYKVRHNNTIWMRALGRNEDGTWIIIDSGSNITPLACWMRASNVKFLKGSLADLPVTWIDLTHSFNYLTGMALYAPPKVFTTSREGNEVTIMWQPIWMTEDDYRGYMIETWVCQEGKLVFQPIGFVTDYYDNEITIRNKGVYSVKVTDEPGCTQPSRGRLYAVEKHGYTNYQILPWPAATP
jgi:CRISPR-associated DxTHG motif protein